MTVFFVSDSHVGHAKMAADRGFATVEEHDEAFCEAWVEHVGKKDDVWMLGDHWLGDFERCAALVRALPGTKHCVWGNHDQGHPMHRDAHRRAKRYEDVFASAAPFARRKIGERHVLLSHFPYNGDGHERDNDRYQQYRLVDLGAPLIHGHTHHQERLSRSDRGSLQIHVGWDAWQRPVALEEIATLLTEDGR